MECWVSFFVVLRNTVWENGISLETLLWNLEYLATFNL